MNDNWLVEIRFDGQQEEYEIPLKSVNSGLKLNQALLYTDEDKVVIERIGETPVEIQRGSRKRLLNSNHPTRILPKDVIRIGSTEYYIARIHRFVQTSRKPSQFGQMANKALLTGAAAMMMAAVPGCHPSEQSKNHAPDNAPAVVNVNDEIAQAVAESDTNKNPNTENSNPEIDNPEIAVVPDDTADSNIADNQSDENDNMSKCDDGQIMCLSNNRYQCENHRWKIVEKCKKPATCNEKREFDKKLDKTIVTETKCDNTEPCQNGQYVCYGATIRCEQSPGLGCNVNDEMYKCVNNEWKFEKKCPSGETCWLDEDMKASCVQHARAVGKPAFGNDCSKNELKCDSENAIMFCHHGFWRYRKVCDDPEVCKSISSTNAICVSPDKK